MKSTILYIDEEEKALRAYSRRLKQIAGEEITIAAVAPFPSIDEMAASIAAHEDLASIIIDNRLSAAGTANYLGIELAKRIRQVDDLIPIYILTNNTDDVNEDLGNVEDVLSKGDLSRPTERETISLRLKRRIGKYRQILGDREKEFEKLLRRLYEGSLTEEEQNRLNELSYQREKREYGLNIADSDDLIRQVQQAEIELERIEAALKGH